MKPWFALAIIVLSWTSLHAGDYEASLILRTNANAWKVGEPIPPKLLKYKTSYEEGSCFPNPAGTESIFSDITNYPLLKEITFKTNIDDRIFTNTVNQALVVAGPSRFFQDVIDTVKATPDFLRVKRIKDLQAQSQVKHVVVDSLYISYADMPEKEIKQTLAAIENELKHGESWAKVYKEWSEKLEYPWQEKLDGRVLKGTRTKLGNLGDFVIPQNNNKPFWYRENWMPKAHIGALFSARQGDVLVLFDKEDLSSFPTLAGKETGERLVLYQVREVWPTRR